MLKDDLKCVLIGQNVNIYNDLAKLVKKIDATSRFKQVALSEAAIKSTLQKVSGPCLIFVSDEVPFSLELLSDLTWQYHADAIIVIVSKKSRSISIKEPFNNTQFARIKLENKNLENSTIMEFLIKSAREKAEFRRCKNLLGVSEKRCQWLVDSSREAVAFISRDMHWYANTAYLNLFDISTIQNLRSITVKDLIIADEHLLFDSFLKNNGSSNKTKRSILLSMQKMNGSNFRAKVYLIPSVFKGQKCYQLWIRELVSVSQDQELIKKQNHDAQDHVIQDNGKNQASESITAEGESENENPFSQLLKNEHKTSLEETPPSPKSESHNEATESLVKKAVDQNALLKGVIRRKEARIVVKPLNYLRQDESSYKNYIKHQLLSLNVAAAQKKGIDDLLSKLPDSYDVQMHRIFWDKVKFSRVVQILIQRKKISANLMLKVSESALLDESFLDWLIPGLKRLGDKSKNLTFMVPANINENEYKQVLRFINKIRHFQCKIALDSFSINRGTIVLLKYSNPEFVRLSLPWTRQIQGDNEKEIRLSSAIRQLESKGIQVIAPCGYSKDMRRLFVLSGASFCQERL